MFCFSASSSNLVSTGSDSSPTDRAARPKKTQEQKIFGDYFLNVTVKCLQKNVRGVRTVELDAHLAPLLVVDDRVGVVVRLPDDNLGVLLRTGSCGAGRGVGRGQRTDKQPGLFMATRH